MAKHIVISVIWVLLAGLLPALAQAQSLGAYSNTSVAAGQNTIVTPGAAPTNTVRATASTNTNFTGVLTVNPTTGVVTVTDAKQAGVYMVTVTAFSSAGSTATATFTLTVTDPACSVGNFRGSLLRVGDQPISVAIGDFNGDGKPDLATANSNSDDVSILLGNGDGAFSGSTNIPVGDRPESVAIGDFNGDGKPDLATANFNSDNVSILLGDGLGGFGSATNFGVGDRPRSVAIGDFNGDGKPDLATANTGSDNVSILLGDGLGGFGSATNFGVGGEPYSVAIGDFNGDGKMDLATADNNSGNPSIANISILLGNGDGTFSSATTVRAGTQPTSIATGDFNADGKPDLAVANSVSDDVSILLGDGAGGFGSATNIPIGDLQSVSIGDFNGDGKQDFAATNVSSDNVSILLGDGLGGFGSATNVAVGDGPRSIAIGDFNGDGAPDFATANASFDNVSILLGDGLGGFIGITTVGVGGGPQSVAIGDFNGDGRQDLATANRISDNVSIRLGDGIGGFSVTPNVAVGDVPASVAIGDFNGDGQQDLATANRSSNNVSILLGDGLGGISSATTVGVNGPESVAIGDFNGDGRQDLVTANQSSDNVSILLGDGLGGFGGATNFAVGDSPDQLAIGDFNGDGAPDLAVANVSSDNVSILLGDGMGGFGSATNVGVGDSPQSVAIGDFNGDGWQDLAVANSSSDNVSILLGDGMGGFGSATNVAVGDRPYPVVIGDFNGDGLQDLAVGNDGSYYVSILPGDGLGSFSSGTTVDIGRDIEAMAIGDFNGDGLQDFVAVGAEYGAAIRLGVAGEINLKGNGMDIEDGDNSPSATDHTDFGTTTGAPITRTFTIQNTGREVLNLASGAITISGPDAALFSVSNITLPAAVNGPNGSIIFDVTYTPVGAGTHTAEINIANNDCNEADYNFAIQGRTCSPPSFSACPAAPVTANTVAGQCTAAVAYTVTADGTPAPTLTYAFMGATTGNGNGTGSGATFEKGNTTVTVTATNPCGTLTCSFTVTVQDNTLPTITCPGAVTVTCSANVPAVNLAAVTASDNCGAPTKLHDGDATGNQTCANRFTITRAYRATDGSGNSTTCAQVITVFDNVMPNFISVPANVTVQCNSIPAVGNPTASDGCGGSVTIAYNGQTSVPGACPDASTITRQWTATDACGNTKTATQRITVIDSQKPNFVSVPANITVQCSAIPNPATPTATDNCDAVVAITYNGQTQTNGACANAYTLTRRWTAEDNCGNTRSISQRITVVDNGKPVFTAFPPNTTITCDENPPAVGSPTASDGCGTATVTYLGQSTTGGNCPGNYQIRRTWRATDACGNTTAATQMIQVSDNGAPVFVTVPGPITIECNQPLPPLVNPTASDACGGYVHITFLGNVPTGSGCDNSYTITRTWRAQDLCGNTATTTQVITVVPVPAGFNPQPPVVAGFNPQQLTDALRVETRSYQARQVETRNCTVSPNPTTDHISLDLTDFAGEAVTISIFSDLGQLVWENRIPAVEDLQVPISLRDAGAAAGMYTVSVRSTGGVVAKRVVLVE